MELIPRARSASDLGMLKRKGRLKEQDKLIEFIINMSQTHAPLETMDKVENWVNEHRLNPFNSKLKRLIPEIGAFHTPLPLVRALEEYDEFFALSLRQYVPPNFAEIRHILNMAQVHAIAPTLRLVTFDADGTLYEDGQHIEQDSVMIALIMELMERGIDVAIVTAAGYPDEPEKFEARVHGLLSAFKKKQLPDDVRNRFHIMGGECNYLLNVTPEYHLEFVPGQQWKCDYMMSWKEDDIAATLDAAETLLVENAKLLQIPVQLIRKARAVGIVPTVSTIYEVLEELAIRLQVGLEEAMGGDGRNAVPFCAFNGGNDVFCDIGDKSYGLQSLMTYLHCQAGEVMHVGDRFTSSGNDNAARELCSILWVAAPEETAFFMELLLDDIKQAHKSELGGKISPRRQNGGGGNGNHAQQPQQQQ